MICKQSLLQILPFATLSFCANKHIRFFLVRKKLEQIDAKWFANNAYCKHCPLQTCPIAQTNIYGFLLVRKKFEQIYAKWFANNAYCQHCPLQPCAQTKI
jgi:hypothetical protein